MLGLLDRYRFAIAAAAGIAWALLPVPIIVALWNSPLAIVQYSVVVETLQSLVTAFLVYQILGAGRIRNTPDPKMCPVCRGEKRRITELIAADRDDIEQIRAMFAPCRACDGTGVVWWKGD